MGARENECQISQNYIIHMTFSEFWLCNHNSCEIWHSFSFCLSFGQHLCKFIGTKDKKRGLVMIGRRFIWRTWRQVQTLIYDNQILIWPFSIILSCMFLFLPIHYVMLWSQLDWPFVLFLFFYKLYTQMRLDSPSFERISCLRKHNIVWKSKTRHRS